MTERADELYGQYGKRGNAEKTENEALEAKVTMNDVTNSEDDAVAAIVGHVNRTADDHPNE
jgi:asparagine synthetase B (glutamine-hydrolysing)